MLFSAQKRLPLPRRSCKNINGSPCGPGQQASGDHDVLPPLLHSQSVWLCPCHASAPASRLPNLHPTCYRPPWPPAGVADVPAELQRKFQLMRELDERTHQLEVQVDEDCLQQLKEAAEKQQGARTRAGGRAGGRGEATGRRQALQQRASAAQHPRHTHAMLPCRPAGAPACPARSRGAAVAHGQAAAGELCRRGGRGRGGDRATGADRAQHRRAGEAVGGEGG